MTRMFLNINFHENNFAHTKKNKSEKDTEISQYNIFMNHTDKKEIHNTIKHIKLTQF